MRRPKLAKTVLYTTTFICVFFIIRRYPIKPQPKQQLIIPLLTQPRLGRLSRKWAPRSAPNSQPSALFLADALKINAPPLPTLGPPKCRRSRRTKPSTNPPRTKRQMDPRATIRRKEGGEESPRLDYAAGCMASKRRIET